MRKLLLLYPLVFISVSTFSQTDCIKTTWLNPIDTISQGMKERNNVFLLESIKDTVVISNIMSSCGCEAPDFNYKKNGGKIIPGIPDTLIIHSRFEGRNGYWDKTTTIKAKTVQGNCLQVIHTIFFLQE